MKRSYFLVAIASLQIILGSITLIGAAQPVQMTQNVVVLQGNYYVFEFGILGTGRLSGNLSELQGVSFDLFVFDDAGYASFRDGSNSVAPLFEQSGTRILFAMNLTGSGQYHVVAVDVPQRRELQIQLDLVVVGLKTGETIVALIVLVGGLALVGATLLGGGHAHAERLVMAAHPFGSGSDSRSRPGRGSGSVPRSPSGSSS